MAPVFMVSKEESLTLNLQAVPNAVCIIYLKPHVQCQNATAMNIFENNFSIHSVHVHICIYITQIFLNFLLQLSVFLHHF
jgi:hypothetical protein